MNGLIQVLTVGAGGFVGVNLRFGLTQLFPNTWFPLATLFANVIAGFAVGFAAGLNDTAFALSPRKKLLINTGLLGGLSTFSTFSVETVTLFQESRYAAAGLNVLLNVGLSVLGVVAGMVAARVLFDRNV